MDNIIEEQTKMIGYEFLCNADMNVIEKALQNGDKETLISVLSTLDQNIQKILDAEEVFKNSNKAFK